MGTKFFKNELNPSEALSFGQGSKYQQASLYPKYWADGVLEINPCFYGLYLPSFDIEKKEVNAKWGKLYFWSISRNGVEVLRRDAGHSVSQGVKYTQSFFEINDGILPDVDVTLQYEFNTALVGDGFTMEEINTLRLSLGLPKLNEADLGFEW